MMMFAPSRVDREEVSIMRNAVLPGSTNGEDLLCLFGPSYLPEHGKYGKLFPLM